jgi:hypothetical protein
MEELRDGRMVPVRAIGEIHVKHTVGQIPAIHDYLEQMAMKDWMYAPGDGSYVLRDIREHRLDYVKPSATG